MKKIFISACMAALALLTGCQQDNEWVNDNATTEGRKVTLTAHLPGDGHSRVALEAGKDNDDNPIVKARWEDSDETFEVYTEGSTSPIIFTQVEGNQFQSNMSETPEGTYTAYYPEKDYNISTQDGTLNQGTCVLMEAAVTDFDSPIKFAHKTAILKPAFKMSDGSDFVDNSSITQIVVHNVKNPKATDATLKSLTVNRTTGLGNDIYLFLPAHENYEAGYTFSFEVTVGGQNYFGTLALAAGKSIEAGKLYTATIKLNQNQYPYVTFTTESGNQTLSYKGTDLQYSTDGDTWISFNGTGSDAVPFGGEIKLYLRGINNLNGTATDPLNYSQISFDNNTPVACTGDIRTLLDYDSYATVKTDGAKFCYLFKDCTALTSAPALPATNLAASCYSGMFSGCTALTTAPALPATNLAASCYSNMFSGCTSLTTAPALPATTLAEFCYSEMFYGCTSLNSVTMLATDINASNCLYEWLYGVAAKGTLYTANETMKQTFGNNKSTYGIPSGWSVEEYSEP